MPAEAIQSVIYTVAISVFYSLSVYAHKYQKGEVFDPKKFLKTVVIGVLGGIAFIIFSIEPSPSNLEQVVGTYGLIAVADHITTTIIREYRKLTGTE